jgi:hypothetical protein
MMPDFGSLPFARWPGNRCPPPSGEGVYMETIPSALNRRFALALSRLKQLASIQIVAAFKRRS